MGTNTNLSWSFAPSIVKGWGDDAFNLHFVCQVGVHDGKLVVTNMEADLYSRGGPPRPDVLHTRSLDLNGLPYAWEVLLLAPEQQVADDVRSRLVNLYTSLMPETEDQKASARQDMLE